MKTKFLTIIISLLSAVSANALELSLEQCREMAIGSDENLKIAQNRVTQSDMDRAIAKTAYLPKFDINGGALYRVPDADMGEAMSFQMRGVWLAGISLTQPVYAGGKIITANKLAKLGREAAEDQLRAVRMDIIADAEKSYWMYVAVLSKIDMIKAYMTQLDSIYDYTRTACELGLTTPLNVSRVESRRSELEYRLLQAQSGADLCRMALCRIIGVDEKEPITPTEDIDAMPQRADRYAGIENRPELSLSRLNIDAKRLDVKMTLSDYLPTVGLQLGYSAFGNIRMKSVTMLPDGTPYPYTQRIDMHGFMGALMVSIPVFHWGEGYKKVKKAKVEVENANLAYERNRKLMELQARQTYSNYVDGYELIATAGKALDEAQKNLNSVTEQYQVGLMTLTDLLEAQSQWHTSYSNLIEAKTQYKINEVEYRRATGLLK